jgi:nucleolar protein 4
MGLRWLNGHAIDYEAVELRKGNKVDKSERKRRPIVEFALENANVVRRRKDRESKARKKRDLPEESIDDAVEGKGDGSNQVSSVAQDGGRRGRKEADRSRDPAAGHARNPEPTKTARRAKIIAKKRAKRRAKKPLASHR